MEWRLEKERRKQEGEDGEKYGCWGRCLLFPDNASKRADTIMISSFLWERKEEKRDTGS